MTVSQPQKWLNLGFGVVLTTLLGTGLIAYRAIINREYPLAMESAVENGYAQLNELLAAIAGAEVSHQAYLETGAEENQRESYVYLERAESFLEGLKAEELDAEDSDIKELDIQEFEALDTEEDIYWLYEEALAPLETALEKRVEGLAKNINEPDSEPPDLQTQIDRATQRSQDQFEIYEALQILLEEGSIDEQWALADTSLSINNRLWILSLVVGVSMLTLCALYLSLRQTLSRSQRVQQQLQQEKETLAATLSTETADLLSAKTSLAEELSRRQAIETTYKEIEQAKELTDIKLNFFSLASHELRTPLSAIMVSAQLLDNPNAQWTEAKRSRNLRRIQSSAKTMTQLLSDILLLTRAEAGKLEFNPQTIEIEAFCTALVESVKFNTQAQHHILVEQKGECAIACLDESLLRAMLMSLLTNAIKYSPQESEIRLIILGKQGHTQFQLTDQGIGIPAADQKQLFESFHRGENAKSIAGTGLGLAVVKKCLDLHGGNISVDSEVGVGTTFTIDLPWIEKIRKKA